MSYAVLVPLAHGFTMFTQHQGTDGSFDPVWARNSEFLGSNPGRVGCFHQVVHTGLQCSKLFKGLEYAMLSVALCIITFLKSFDKNRI